MRISKKSTAIFQKEILGWFAKNKRDFPWRRPTLKLRNGNKGMDPYHILVSEIMSQQTQINRVIPKYEAWIKAFPTVESLAKASARDVLAHWSGLGYNRRALYLQKCAKIITETYKGSFPQDEKLLLRLPGIGKYTARALLCFAFNKQVAVVDTNVRRVILTQMQSSKCKVQKLTEKEIERIAQELLPEGKAREWNQALMDYSAIKLRKSKIDIPSQSQFKDSDRYYRGQILKLLLQKSPQSTNDIQRVFASVSQERMKVIIQSLLRDELIKQTVNNMLSLP